MDREVSQIIALLREGQDAAARALFMTHLLDHCRELDQTYGTLYGWEPNTDEHLWQVFKGVQHWEWLHLDT